MPLHNNSPTPAAVVSEHPSPIDPRWDKQQQPELFQKDAFVL